jgi:hypothetical protein
MRFFVKVSDLLVVPRFGTLLSLDDGDEYRVGQTYGSPTEPNEDLLELLREHREEGVSLKLKEPRRGLNVITSLSGVPLLRREVSPTPTSEEASPSPPPASSEGGASPSTSHTSVPPSSEEPPAS